MQHIIVSTAIQAYEANEKDRHVVVVKTPLSVEDFKILFQNDLQDFVSGYNVVNDKLYVASCAASDFDESHPDYEKDAEVFTNAQKEFSEYMNNKKVFVHNDYKVDLEPFTYSNAQVATFTVQSLEDWLGMKEREATSEFVCSD